MTKAVLRLMGGADLADLIADVTGISKKKVSTLAAQASQDLRARAPREFTALDSSLERSPAEELLLQAFSRVAKLPQVPVAALEGPTALVELILDDEITGQLTTWSEDEEGYFRALALAVAELTTKWYLEDPNARAFATARAVGMGLRNDRDAAGSLARLERGLTEVRGQQASATGVVNVVHRSWSAPRLSEPTIFEVDPYRLGVHPALEVAGQEEGLTAFVDRTSHDEATAALRPLTLPNARPTMLTLVGASCVGKTRTLHHAVLQVLPDWPVLFPSDAPQLRALLEAGVPSGAVLWLDELEIYLDHDEHGRINAAYLSELLQSEGMPAFLVAATLWPEHLAHLTHGGDTTAKVFAGLLGRLSTIIRVPQSLSDDALAGGIDRAAQVDSRLAQAAETCGDADGITQTLAGGVMLASRYDGCDASGAPAFTPSAHALVTAAMDLRRIGFGNPLPRWAVEGAASAYLEPRHYPEVSPEWIGEGLNEATEAIRGVRALAPRGAAPGVTDAYDLHDYLARLHLSGRAHSVTPRPLWTMLASHPGLEAIDPDTRKKLIHAATDRGLYTIATELASTLRVPSAFRPGGVARHELLHVLALRTYQGDEEAWDELCKMAEDGEKGADDARARVLADFAEFGVEDGDGAQALDDLAQLSKDGSTGAKRHLIKLLFRRADDGDPEAMAQVRQIVHDEQRRPDPSDLLVDTLLELANRDDEEALQHLAHLAQSGSSIAEAVLHYRDDSGRLSKGAAILAQARSRASRSGDLSDDEPRAVAKDHAQVALGLQLAELARGGDTTARTQLRELVNKRYHDALGEARAREHPAVPDEYLMWSWDDPVADEYASVLYVPASQGDANALDELRRLATPPGNASQLNRALCDLAQQGFPDVLEEMIELGRRNYEASEMASETLRELAEAGNDSARARLELLADEGYPYADYELEKLVVEDGDLDQLRTLAAIGSSAASWKLTSLLGVSGDEDARKELVRMTHAGQPGAASALLDLHQRRQSSRVVYELDVDGGPVFGPSRG